MWGGENRKTGKEEGIYPGGERGALECWPLNGTWDPIRGDWISRGQGRGGRSSVPGGGSNVPGEGSSVPGGGGSGVPDTMVRVEFSGSEFPKR